MVDLEDMLREKGTAVDARSGAAGEWTVNRLWERGESSGLWMSGDARPRCEERRARVRVPRACK